MTFEEILKTAIARIDKKLAETGQPTNRNPLRIRKEKYYDPIVKILQGTIFDNIENVNFDGNNRLVLYPENEPNLLIGVAETKTYSRAMIPQMQQPIFSMQKGGFTIEIFERLERNLSNESQVFYEKEIEACKYNQTGMAIELYDFIADDPVAGQVRLPIAVDAGEVTKWARDKGPPRTTPDYMPLAVQWRHYCKLAQSSALLKTVLGNTLPQEFPLTHTVKQRQTSR